MRHTCSTCIHDGCCDHYCGGDHYKPEREDSAESRDPLEGYVEPLYDEFGRY